MYKNQKSYEKNRGRIESESKTGLKRKKNNFRRLFLLLLTGFSLVFFLYMHTLKENFGFLSPGLSPIEESHTPVMSFENPVSIDEDDSADHTTGEEIAFFQHSYQIKEKCVFEAPLILQNPELPRGCEITSLAMLLQYAGVAVDKMTLAREIEKEPFFYRGEDGKHYYGNPYYGFVGNIYTLNEPGYGVYHAPLRRLMEKYLPGKSIDLTGCNFQDILIFLSEEIPVLAIVNTDFAELSSADFQIWETSEGPLKITYKQHAVLLTGYDENFVYFNDPLDKIKNKKADRESFEAAWIQMGSQAITYLPY